MTALYKIENNVSIPEQGRGGGIRNERSATILALKPGQSFFVPKNKACKASEISKLLQSNVTSVKKNFPNRVYTIRTITDNGREGARCWRLADKRKR